MMKRWQPVTGPIYEDKAMGTNVEANGQELSIYSLYADTSELSVMLPDNLRLCQLVEVDDPLAFEPKNNHGVHIHEGEIYFDFHNTQRGTSFEGICALIESLLYGLKQLSEKEQQL